VQPRRSLPADAVEQLDAACRAGGSSLYGTGSSPGFISDVVPIALLLPGPVDARRAAHARSIFGPSLQAHVRGRIVSDAGNASVC